MSMIRVTREFHFSMGHTLHNYEGKCANLHGHNYRCKVTLEGIENLKTDMLIDFGDFKSKVETILEEYDHHFMIHEDDPRAEALQAIDPTVVFVPANPTAEYLAGDIMQSIDDDMFMGYPPNDHFLPRLNRYNGTDPIIFDTIVELWETADCSAIASHKIQIGDHRPRGEYQADVRPNRIKVFDPVYDQWVKEYEEATIADES